MDLHDQYQQQKQQQQQHLASQTYAPSQSYAQSTQSYYDSYPQQQYPYDNYSHYYGNPSYQHHQLQSQQEPNSIHPPGVPIMPDPTLLDPTQYTNQLNSYYAQSQLAPYAGNVDSYQQWQGSYGGVGAVPLQSQAGQQAPYSSAGNISGVRPYGGASRGHLGPRSKGSTPFRGRGHGRGRNGNTAPNSVASVAGEAMTLSQGSSGSNQPTAPVLPASMAWCELCRVDCNTFAILEQHKNGKKHKKNLKVQEELKKLNKELVGGQNMQVLKPELNSQTSNHNQTEKAEAYVEKKLAKESLSNQPSVNENKFEIEQQKETDEAGQAEDLTRKSSMDGARGQGLKRKMRGGRGGKWMRTQEGSRRSVEPSKPKEVIPLICEMCNAKCESPAVFDSHLKGKKHLANLKRFQGQQEAALQALYPALQALYPTLQALCQLNPNALATFAPQLHQQDFHGLQSLIQPGSSSFSQGQFSALGPLIDIASALPSAMVTNNQQASMLQGSSTSVPANSQDEPLEFVKKADGSGDSSVVPLQNTLARADQLSSDSQTGGAVGVPDSETTPSLKVLPPETESKSDKLASESK